MSRVAPMRSERRSYVVPRCIACGLLVTVAACGNPSAPPFTDPRGLLLVVRSAGREQAEIYAMRPDGTDRRQLTRNTVIDAFPDWAPDGRRIVFIRVVPGAGEEIWVMNADGSGQRQLLDATNSPEHPRWSPDGQRIAFAAYDPSVGMFRPYLMNADGSNVHPLSSSAGDAFSVEWSPDGTQLLFLSNRAPPFVLRMYVMQADGSGERQLAGDSACSSNVGEPRWSPDGVRIAYTCYQSVVAVYTIGANGTDSVRLTAPGSGPVWSPDGRQLAFSSNRDGSYDVYVMDLSTGAVSRVTNDGALYGVAAWGGGR
jgi:Tol biopolymer transport system component